jgi:hypothetical protein
MGAGGKTASPFLFLYVEFFFALLGAPPDRKRLVIHDVGHMPALNELIRDVLGWFDRYLGPVRTK